MRLGQLARKLAVRPSEIVSFLATKGVTVEDNSNSRIEDDHVSLLVQKFAPQLLNEITQTTPSVTEKVISVQEDLHPQPEPVITVDDDQPVANLATEENTEEKPEVIKAPKVELSGLKVLGKIELPGTKKKLEEEKIPEENQEAKPKSAVSPDAERRSNRDRKPRKEYQQKPKVNSVAAERERQAEANKRRREEDAERAKDQRTKNYQKRVKPSTPTKRATLIEDHSEEVSTIEKRPPPKSWFGRLIRWLKIED